MSTTLFRIAPARPRPSTLLDAVSSGTDTEVLAFLATGSDPNAAIGRKEEAPLHIACHRGYTAVVELLLDYGASLDVEDDSQNQPLHCAASDGRLDVVQVLINHGANLTARNRDMQIPLHLASEHGYLDVVKMLLKASKKGATVSPRPRYSFSPLVFACEAGNVSLVKELMKRMTMEEINTTTATMGTPIYIAAFRGRAEVVKVMLEAGVDHETIHYGETPFEAAVKEGHRDVVAVFKAFYRGSEGRDGGQDDIDVSASKSKSHVEELGSGSRIEELDDDDAAAEESKSESLTLPPHYSR
ncbi:ankyrin repeat-containing domain protein [Rhexocercosporidium sp. MPI-PUGE-AT-0058]|nr:ankyrin repeat-containing domain protein [Rhexocercosporidium sp. MPI-PUGE-AT-0058]